MGPRKEFNQEGLHKEVSYLLYYRPIIIGVLSPNSSSSLPNSPVANMTVRELKSAETKDKYKVVSVWDHKTATAHGSARIVMPERMYQLILGESPGEETDLQLSPQQPCFQGDVGEAKGSSMYLHVKYCTV